MIKSHCFSDEWLESFRRQERYKKIDKIILAKMIYALHLLERLKANGLKFIFKGGTSLVLLLKEDNRFSIDIDIICNMRRSEIEDILQKVVASSNFIEYRLDEHRSYKPGVPKAHYKFKFETRNRGSGTILLDILIGESTDPEIKDIPISTKWIEVEYETSISVPSIDAIAGDKLTAFAPATIGIPYFKGKDMQSFSMEMCKQLFDLSKLFEHIENMETVAESYKVFSDQEIEYRKDSRQDSIITPEMALQDTIETCLIFAKRGAGSKEEKSKFAELQKGIRAFGTGYLMSGNFRIDDAIPASARVAHLAAKLLVNDLSPIHYYTAQNIEEINIKNPSWNFLNRLKRQPDQSSFYFWHQTVQLLSEFEPKSGPNSR